MQEDIWFSRLEEKLENVPIYGQPRARKRAWEYHVKGKTLEGGIILEFGVASGGSIGWFPKHFAGTEIYGFDTFEGLPEDWDLGSEVIRKGHFSSQGIPPNIPEVSYVKGLFEDTLPVFIKEHEGKFAKIIHFDADLYNSTKTIFNYVKPFIRKGTFLLFDELTHSSREHPHYTKNREHEYKAFMEFCEENPKFDFEVVARTNICQVIIKVTNI